MMILARRRIAVTLGAMQSLLVSVLLAACGQQHDGGNAAPQSAVRAAAPSSVSSDVTSNTQAAAPSASKPSTGDSPAPSVAPDAVLRAAAPAKGASVPYDAAPWRDHPVPLSAMAQLGKQLFFEKSLSGSGKMACASCHDPSHAYGPPNGLAVQLGGLDMQKQGARAVPSLKYLEHNPDFTIGPNSSVPDTDVATAAPAAPVSDVKVASVAKGGNPTGAAAAAQQAAANNVPQGGFDWDGRIDTFQDQATGPLLDPHEMANKNASEVVSKLRDLPYAAKFKQLFGDRIFDDEHLAISEALFALTRYQLEDPSFHPYDSKYDYYLAGKATLSEQEMRGLKLFEDPNKGNCSSCHIDKPSVDGKFPPVFTDFQFEAFGAPRNMEIAANRNPHYYDLGLCGPVRKDYTHVDAYCGLFKTPTLRNVLSRKVFFHNGVFHSIDDVMHFYVQRETDPARWYPKGKNGKLDVYNDLPARYKKNVDVADAPFDRKHGDAPALNDGEIKDVIAFLGTLNDGYQPEQAAK
ncbi:cytochrome-c peroxidase [Robbsia andropogonis]|uniref:cytochrome-c peroxidase n=1 Tax=Robbsia andropogonis TaxID=28092 RepID=UPI0020A1A345|nr:cytochrome c peroxidase [Robbsia andropogonis]MCP1118966.1 cytochrome-c peroxidase [Robbsia andropogonis]MCP1128682.1 cytochrome-c peroxidase [Robbsia andropogonis]